MHCTFLPGGTIVCGDRRKPARCSGCGEMTATKLCDGMAPSGATCDAAICAHCATSIGENQDLCPGCAAARPSSEAGAGTESGSSGPGAGAVPPVHEPARCKGKNCGAAIFWVMRIDSDGEIVRVPPKTGRPKSFPVDVEPTDKGNVEIFARGKSLVGWTLSRVAADEYRAKCVALKTKPRLRMPHHATCPDRALWGRK